MSYSDDFKANAIALFEVESAKDGISDRQAARHVSKALRAKGKAPDHRTIIRWSRDGKNVSHEVRRSVHEKKRDLEEVLTEIVANASGAQLDFIQKLRDHKHLAPDVLIEAIKTLSVVTGISVEKIQLLRGEPTAINDQRGASVNVFTQFNQKNG